MIVRAGDLQPAGLRVDQAVHAGRLTWEQGSEIEVTGGRLTAHVSPSRTGLACRGSIDAEALVPCSRCLVSYPLPVQREFEVRYVPAPTGYAPENAEVQVQREDLDIAYLNEEGEFDIEELISEQIYLEIPMKPLCSPACRGLCPGCGCNLNIEYCRCKVPAV